MNTYRFASLSQMTFVGLLLIAEVLVSCLAKETGSTSTVNLAVATFALGAAFIGLAAEWRAPSSRLALVALIEGVVFLAAGSVGVILLLV